MRETGAVARQRSRQWKGEERGQAHLPDQELIDLATLMLIDRLSRLTATVVLRSLGVGKAGLPPLLSLRLPRLNVSIFCGRLRAQSLDIRAAGFLFKGAVLHAGWDARGHALGGSVVEPLDLLA